MATTAAPASAPAPATAPAPARSGSTAPATPPRDARRPDTNQRATIFLLVLGITILMTVLAQVGWWFALAHGVVTAGAASMIVAHVTFATARVLLGAWCSVTAMDRAFGCRPTWPVAVGAHLVGVLVSKAVVLGPPPALAALLLCVGLALPAWTFVRRAG